MFQCYIGKKAELWPAFFIGAQTLLCTVAHYSAWGKCAKSTDSSQQHIANISISSTFWMTVKVCDIKWFHTWILHNTALLMCIAHTLLLNSICDLSGHCGLVVSTFAATTMVGGWFLPHVFLCDLGVSSEYSSFLPKSKDGNIGHFSKVYVMCEWGGEQLCPVMCWNSIQCIHHNAPRLPWDRIQVFCYPVQGKWLRKWMGVYGWVDVMSWVSIFNWLKLSNILFLWVCTWSILI